MQSFLSAYQFGHIPFCECCQEHTQFTAIGFSSPSGALTLDNPNSSIDVTMIANRSEIKLICTRCGNQMYRFNDRVKTSYGEASPFLKSFFSRAEIEGYKSVEGGCWGFAFFVFGLGCVILAFIVGVNSLGLAVCFGLVGLILVMAGLGLLQANEAKIEKLEPITIKNPNGQPFTFDPEAGQPPRNNED